MISMSLDPIFISILTDIVTTLAGAMSPGVYNTMMKTALPLLSSATANAKEEESWTASTAIDLMTSLARGAPESGLGDDFFALAAPALFSSLGKAEDRDLIQVYDAALLHFLAYQSQRPTEWYRMPYNNHQERLPPSGVLEGW